MLVISKKDLQDLKAELKAELIKEMQVPEPHDKVYPLSEAKATWFYGEGGYNKYSNSAMEREFETFDVHKVWEHIRRLTTIILGKRYLAQLANSDPEICNMVCNQLCSTVLELRKSSEVQSQISQKEVHPCQEKPRA